MNHKPSLMDVILSVLSAFCGIQSSRNQNRDFQNGQPIYFIAAGICLTLLLVFGIWLVVRLVLASC